MKMHPIKKRAAPEKDSKPKGAVEAPKVNNNDGHPQQAAPKTKPKTQRQVTPVESKKRIMHEVAPQDEVPSVYLLVGAALVLGGAIYWQRKRQYESRGMHKKQEVDLTA